MRKSVLAMVALALVACGGDDETGATGGTTASTSGAGGSGAGGSGAGGSGETAGAGGGSGAVLFPLVDGTVWIFEVTKIGNGGACGPGTFKSQVTAAKELDGKPSFSVSPWCDAVSTNGVYAAGAGDELFYRFDNEWQLILDGNVTEGHKWTFQGLEYQWKKLGHQTLGGKEYDDCWGAGRTDAPLVYDIYCRGVGAIRHHNEVDGNGFDAALK